MPRSVNIIDAPATIPGAIMFLRFYQILNRIPDATCLFIKTNVAEQLKRARGKIAACRIQNGVVVCKRHVFQPGGSNIFVERCPAAVAALETELPTQRPPE